MTIEDRIIQAEKEFMDINVDPAEWIIVTPYTLSAISDSDDFEEMNSYHGLRVAVSNHPSISEFKLAKGV